MRRSNVSRFAGFLALAGLATGLGLGLTSASAFAQASGAVAPGTSPSPEVIAPIDWAMGLQAAAGPVKDAIHDFNQLVLWIITAITIFVGVLLLYVMWRFRASKNPVPSRTSHHTLLEVAWTVVPVLILIVIAIPSFRLIYYQDRAVDADMTINVTGRQWYWHYAYPDAGNLAFDSYPVATADLQPGQLRNLDVDNPLVIPVGKNIRVLTTGQDVIHSFFVPSLGVQKYTIPGRTLETWFRADRAGTFYGQCNQICGQNHWFMPIVVKAVPQAEYDAWLEQARQRFAADQGAPAPVVAQSGVTQPGGVTTVAELSR
ncbi:cytochrome c oxidase subunit II [Roseomonas aerophila]|uniref:Cytochrome c oxidase subunit 2 n=1 Tax=Teichococcus aerophilus TaxID=1224513 RepID=A0ABR7RQ98_9PROT|nr:cytochrome c oxidase subunit II [Pseudoroseomonas aerophila]MBC9208742.1 cytochrome c oxidase subunit II [Pseudoroseomonas aerophila]